MSIQKYNRLKQEIAKLEREAEKVRKDALRAAVQQIKSLMAEYGVTIEDLEAHPGPGRPKKARNDNGKTAEKADRPRDKVAPKYRSQTNPDLTWTGRGRTPKWISEWTAAGNKLEDLLIPAAS